MPALPVLVCLCAVIAHAQTVKLELQPIDDWEQGRTRQESSDEEMRNFYEELGVTFPPGAFVSYQHGSMVMRNTPENLRRAREATNRMDLTPSQVEIVFTTWELSVELAASLGLDGAAAPDPESTPFGARVPRILMREEAEKLSNHLRASGAKIVGSASVATVTGSTATTKNVTRLKTGGEDPPTEIGVIFTVTPTVGSDGITINLELEPLLRSFHGWGETPAGESYPIIKEVETQTNIIVRSGGTVILAQQTPLVEEGEGPRLLSTATATIEYLR